MATYTQSVPYYFYINVVFHEFMYVYRLVAFRFPFYIFKLYYTYAPRNHHVIVTLQVVLVDRLLLVCVYCRTRSIKERESSAYRFRLQTVSTIDGSLPFRTCCAHFILYRTTVRVSNLTLSYQIQIQILLVSLIYEEY